MRFPWRWSNIPIPEGFIAAVALGTLLHLACPSRLPGPARTLRILGANCAMAGLALAAWATATAGLVDVARPSALIASGPYRFTRNPMYLGWTLLYLGTALISRRAWMLLLLPVVLAWVHREVLREERTLEAAFGDRYRRYCAIAPRYFW